MRLGNLKVSEFENLKMKISRLFKAVVLVASSMMVFACRHGVSNDHLPPAVMQKVLLDISLAEAYSVNIKDSVHRGNIKNTDSLSLFYKAIFAHHKITPEQLTTSLEWYKAHPEELDSVYSKMVPVATRWQDKLPPAKPVAVPTTPPQPPTVHLSSRPAAPNKKKE